MFDVRSSGEARFEARVSRAIFEGLLNNGYFHFKNGDREYMCAGK